MALTGCVCELILLAFYAVLERFCIAARDLDALLYALRAHVRHGGDS